MVPSLGCCPAGLPGRSGSDADAWASVVIHGARTVVTWVVRRHLLRGDGFPHRVQPHLKAEAESIGLVIVGKSSTRLMEDVLRRPGAVRVGFCALAGGTDRGRVLDGGGHGLVNQPEPLTSRFHEGGV